MNFHLFRSKDIDPEQLNANFEQIEQLILDRSKREHPIGSLYFAAMATNPADILGFGTWAVFGAGKVFVGLDSTDTDFDTAKESGGSKTVTLTAAQSGLVGHAHTVNDPGHVHTGINGPENSVWAAPNLVGGYHYQAAAPVILTLLNAAYTGLAVNAVAAANAASAHSNMPPFIVVYAWERTA